MYHQKALIHFPKELVDEPIISQMKDTHKVGFNILKAQVNPDEDGMLILELFGDEDAVNSSLDFLRHKGLQVEPTAENLVIVWEKCTHCGVCVAQCPSGALGIEPDSQLLAYDTDKCILCQLCVPACIYQAIEFKGGL